MQFDVKDREVKHDIWTRRRAVIFRFFGDILLIDKVVKVFFLLSSVSGLVLGLSFMLSYDTWISFFIGAAIGFAAVFGMTFGILYLFGKLADKIMGKLCDKYNEERKKYMTESLEEIGYKVDEKIFPAEYKNENNAIILHNYTIEHLFFLDEKTTHIDVIYNPIVNDRMLSKRVGLGIRSFDSLFEVNWDDEVKARTYLSSTMVLSLQNNAKKIENFIDKKIEINNNTAKFVSSYRGLLQLSNTYFQEIPDIIANAQEVVEESKKTILYNEEFIFLSKER